MPLEKDIVVAIAGSSVIAGVIAGLVSLRANARNIKVANVTNERAKWRDKVREKALEVQKSLGDAKQLSELHLQFALILNPRDSEDREILRLIDSAPTKESHDATLKEFTARVSLLLKHDWERAKWESSSIFTRWPTCPRRLKYQAFLKEVNSRSQSNVTAPSD